MSEFRIIISGCLLSTAPGIIFLIGFSNHSLYLMLPPLILFVPWLFFWRFYSEEIEYRYDARSDLDFYDYQDWILEADKKVFVLVSLIPFGVLGWILRCPEISSRIFQLRRQVELYSLFEDKTWESITEFQSDLSFVYNEMQELPEKEQRTLLKVIVISFQRKLKEEIKSLFLARKELVEIKTENSLSDLYEFLVRTAENDSERITEIILEDRRLFQEIRNIKEIVKYAERVIRRI